VQLAAAEGSARNMDFGAMGALFGSGLGAGGGGYTNTAEGKVIVAAFTDSYNNLVRAVRNYKAQEVKGGLGTGGNLGVQGAAEAQGALRSTATPSTKTTPAASMATVTTGGCSSSRPASTRGRSTGTAC
jgi:hypothetical protein